ncbi:minor capsid protein [Burkholderia sp. PU8-34]
MNRYSEHLYANALSVADEWSYLQWICVGDNRACDVCRKRDGRVFHISDPIWRLLPPIHPGCRCHFRLRRQSDLDRLGLLVSSGHEFMDETGAPR